MILTLLDTNTEAGDAVSNFTSSIDSTYDEYMFVCTDIGPATDAVTFQFQASTDSGSNYNTTATTTFFRAYHTESGSEAAVGYLTGDDQAQGTAFVNLSETEQVGNGADESLSCILHLFAPSNTTYVKHFYATSVYNSAANAAQHSFTAGYFNTTSAIDAISFKMSSGNMDGVIQMYGIA